ncbi:hypothetical protein BC834DRAFT_883593 [Gloeopeniophorella convolvens]|nr:hypothetical protein BC834DRAFT_883593 [Gloeopeniophorella convolvens]
MPGTLGSVLRAWRRRARALTRSGPILTAHMPYHGEMAQTIRIGLAISPACALSAPAGPGLPTGTLARLEFWRPSFSDTQKSIYQCLEISKHGVRQVPQDVQYNLCRDVPCRARRARAATRGGQLMVLEMVRVPAESAAPVVSRKCPANYDDQTIAVHSTFCYHYVLSGDRHKPWNSLDLRNWEIASVAWD